MGRQYCKNDAKINHNFIVHAFSTNKSNAITQDWGKSVMPV